MPNKAMQQNAANSSSADSLNPRGPLCGIVLAAGYARRFGADKRQASFNHHDTLLTKAIHLIEPLCQTVFVTLKPEDNATQLLGRWHSHPKVKVVVAERALQGMGCSLADTMAAITEAEQSTKTTFAGVLVQLADMPYVMHDTLQQLVSRFTTDKITFPCYLSAHKENKWGHPVIFGRHWFSSLQRLQGDRGGKAIIKAHPCARQEIVVDDPGILRDIDTPQDLELCG